MMQVEINGQVFDIDERDTVVIHLPGTDWVMTYFGHRKGEMDLRIDRKP